MNDKIISTSTKINKLKFEKKKKNSIREPIPHSTGKQFSTPWDKKEVKEIKDQETFRVNSDSFVKVQILFKQRK